MTAQEDGGAGQPVVHVPLPGDGAVARAEGEPATRRWGRQETVIRCKEKQHSTYLKQEDVAPGVTTK